MLAKLGGQFWEMLVLESFDEKGTVSGELRETECVISAVSDNGGMDKEDVVYVCNGILVVVV